MELKCLSLTTYSINNIGIQIYGRINLPKTQVVTNNYELKIYL